MKTHNKPIEYDIHLKYLCTNCGSSHWLSFKEASTKNFKIVCECDNIFMVKRVSDFKLKYYKTLTKSKPETKPEEESIKTEAIKKNIIPNDILETAINSLLTFGFTKNEAKSLIIKTYNILPTTDIALLIKKSLESLKNVK